MAKSKKAVKKNPLIKGYSESTISKNITKMVREGYKRPRAVAAAYREARKIFKHRNPGKTLPEYLRAKKTIKKSSTHPGKPHVNYVITAMVKGKKHYFGGVKNDRDIMTTNIKEAATWHYKSMARGYAQHLANKYNASFWVEGN